LLSKIKRFASDSKKKQTSIKGRRASQEGNGDEHSHIVESNVTSKKSEMFNIQKEGTHSHFDLTGSETESTLHNEMFEFRESQEKTQVKLEILEKMNQDAQMHSRALFEEFLKMRANEEKLLSTIKGISVELKKLKEQEQKVNERVQPENSVSSNSCAPKLLYSNGIQPFEYPQSFETSKAINRGYSIKSNADEDLLYQSSNQISYLTDANTSNNELGSLFEYKPQSESFLKGMEDCFPEKEDLGLIFEPIFLQKMDSL